MSESQTASAGATVAAQTPISPPNSHHVRKVLEHFNRHAPLSLTGPTGIEEQNRYNLTNDVVLRKVYPGEVENNGSNGASCRKNAQFEPNGQVFEQFKSFAIQKALAMRYQQEQFIQAEKERDRSRERQLNGRARQNSGPNRGSNHLTGEEIRKLRENQKAQERAKVEEEKRSREARSEHSNKEGRSSTKPIFKSPQSVPNQTIPILSSNDKSWSELEETNLEGEQISCFNVGGEFRLCLPQILNSVLEKVSLPAINQACDDLQIYCSTCSAEQLQVLKDAKVLPMAAHQCGLITKSDAERLCSYLLDKNPPRASVFDPKSSPFSFKVQHECFGRCEGLVLPEAYTTPSARCIECLQCEGLFSPQKFVCHAHDNSENRTCHWGFDSNNWRTYLRLSEDYTEEEQERHMKVMVDFKNRYHPSSSNSNKRRQEGDHYDSKREGPTHSKRTKPETEVSPSNSVADPYTAIWNNYAKHMFPNVPPNIYPKAGAFPPFPPYSAALGSPYPRGPPLEASPDLRRVRPEEGNSHGSTPHTPHERYKSESPTIKRKPSSPEKEDPHFPSLAEEISTVAEALAGAPAPAKDTVLRILERLTLRLDRAERDRDIAIGRCRELEEELSKKRGELRELLRQDSSRVTTSCGRIDEVIRQNIGKQDDTEATTTRNCGSNIKVEKDENRASVVVSEQSKESGVEEQTTPEESSNRHDTSFVSSGKRLKMEMESPATVIDESGGELRVSRCLSARSEERNFSSDETLKEESKLDEKQIVSKTKEPEDLQERMIKMEAELTALREELSGRSQPKLQAAAPPPTHVNSHTPHSTGSQSPNPGVTSTNTSVIIKKPAGADQ